MTSENNSFENLDFSDKALPKGEYENCVFKNCDFSNCDISGYRFTESQFIDCNLSMVLLNKTTLNTVHFKSCKMLGLKFENCLALLFSVSFENCTLDFSSFFKVKLKKTKIEDCSLKEVDFTETDLSGTLLTNCNLEDASFERSILEAADLRDSYNFRIDPESNKIKKAKFSRNAVDGLLSKYDIRIE